MSRPPLEQSLKHHSRSVGRSVCRRMSRLPVPHKGTGLQGVGRSVCRRMSRQNMHKNCANMLKSVGRSVCRRMSRHGRLPPIVAPGQSVGRSVCRRMSRRPTRSDSAETSEWCRQISLSADEPTVSGVNSLRFTECVGRSVCRRMSRHCIRAKVVRRR